MASHILIYGPYKVQSHTPIDYIILTWRAGKVTALDPVMLAEFLLMMASMSNLVTNAHICKCLVEEEVVVVMIHW